MKSRLIFLFLLVPLILAAQNYDYDDIYFNPKTDLAPQKKMVKESATQLRQDSAFADSVYEESLMSENNEYAQRIKDFHSDNTFGEDIADSNYTKVSLGDGNYNVNVQGGDVTVTPLYGYNNYSNYYWGSPYYSNAWMWQMYSPFGYYSYGNYYDPFWGPYSFYSPYYYGYPYYGYNYYGYPYYYGGYYGYWNDPYYYGGGYVTYRRSDNENNRRLANITRSGYTDEARRISNGASSSSRVSSNALPSRRTMVQNDTRVTRTDYNSRVLPARRTDVSNETRRVTVNNSRSLPARPVTSYRSGSDYRLDRTTTTNGRTYYSRPSSNTRYSAPVNSSRSNYTTRSSSTSTRSYSSGSSYSGSSSRSGYSSGGSRNGSSSSTSRSSGGRR